MSREWKPGDVASILRNGTQPAFRTDKGWTYIDGSTQGVGADRYAFRPLVVIDPEDRDEVARLVNLYEDRRPGNTRLLDHMTTALREFANQTPPKPAEPFGRGAVVVDASGLEWVRVHPGGKAWVSGYETWANWSEIDVASVVRP